MSKPRSNTRRFVNAAWALLTFQLIASAGAVVVTGLAAFHVRDLVRDAAAPSGPVQEAVPEPPQEQTQMQPPAPEGPSVSPAPPPVQIAPCLRVRNPTHVDARAGWCDSGLVVQTGQRYFVRIGEGLWSNAGAPSYGAAGAGGGWPGTIVADAPIGALIGRVGDATFAIGAGPEFISPASGPLHLSMNDVPGGFDDNQGWVEVYIYGADSIQ